MSGQLRGLERQERANWSPVSLEIQLQDELRAATPFQNLLFAFHFGAGTASVHDAPIIDPGLSPINSGDVYECWWHRGEVEYRNVGDIRVAECEDYACIALQRPEPPNEGFPAFVRDAYEDLLGAAAGTGHQHVVRMWNYFPSINAGEGNAERYRQFSVGRAEAFAATGIGRDRSPAGTAIGCNEGGNLSIVALTTRHQAVPVENPRQVSAYLYPPRYGIESPIFSRGVCVTDSGRHLFLLSGTASVVGHESAHPYDTAAQTDETLRNLEHLSDALAPWSDSHSRSILGPKAIQRIYLRNPKDQELVAARLRSRLGDISGTAVFLHGDICRRELMIEIDGATTI